MFRPLAFIALLLISTSALAQERNTRPQPVPITTTIPAARDIAYPGTMELEVDATDLDQRIFRVKQTIPVANGGRMTLLYPQWLPGNHAPRGQIEKLAGLKITAGGRALPWTRDTVNMYAFHIDVPEGARRIEANFEFLSATDPAQGRVVVTRNMMNLQWEAVTLYPAGYFTRNIPVSATVKYPTGWRAAAGLPARATGSTYRYETTSVETLIDSPVFAGRYFREEKLSDRVDLNIVADAPEDLVIRPDQLEAHRKLVTQAVKLFGAQHYDRYEFLLALTDEMGGIGLEHHRSSENGVNPEYFTDWDAGPGRRNLLPHEMVHSWIGKYRRGADMWTPDYSVPMQGSLLWVYEGQTQFWGYVLGARSGLFSKDDTLGAYAAIMAGLDNRPARDWRALIDTTNDPVISARRPKGWVSWQRSEDYYNEGLLVWMEVDSILRQQSGGRKSMDDFARAFFGMNDGDWGVLTYTFDDLVTTLNGIQPYDWRTLLRTRLTETGARAPLSGFTANGYRLSYTEEPTLFWKDSEKTRKVADHSYSLGMILPADGKIGTVIWDSPAFKAGLTVDQQVTAVNGRAYSPEVLKAAITEAKTSRAPIRLLVKQGDLVREVPVTWTGGVRYPRLEKTGTGVTGLDRLLEAK